MKIQFELDLADAQAPDVFDQRKNLLFLLEVVVEMNRQALRAGRSFAQSGVTSPDFDDVDAMALWRCAELRERGVIAKPYLKIKRLPSGAVLYRLEVRGRCINCNHDNCENCFECREACAL